MHFQVGHLLREVRMAERGTVSVDGASSRPTLSNGAIHQAFAGGTMGHGTLMAVGLLVSGGRSWCGVHPQQ